MQKNAAEKPAPVDPFEYSRAAERLLSLFGTAVFDSAAAAFQSFSAPDALAEVIHAVKVCGEEPLFYYYFSKLLPPNEANELKLLAAAMSGRQLQYEYYLRELYGIFEAEKIPYIPIKGADLAFRCYPVACARFLGDLDILIRREDLDRTADALRKNEWTQKYDYANFQHVGAFKRKKIMVLEPHFALPNCKDMDPDEVWDLSIPDPKSAVRRRLPPELSFLVVMRHLEATEWGRSSILRFLFDAAFLLKTDPPDWTRLRELESRWGFSDSRILLAAFPEFFPARILANSGGPVDPVRVKQLRRLVDNAALYPDEKDVYMMRKDKFSRAWLERRLVGWKPEVLRKKYKIPPNRPAMLAKAYLRDFISKCGFLLGSIFRRKDSRLADYLRDVEDFRIYASKKSS